MKFAVFCPAILLALLDSHIHVQAVKIASTEDYSLIQDTSAADDVLSLAQWDSTLPMGSNDLNVGQHRGQFYLGQLSSDYDT